MKRHPISLTRALLAATTICAGITLGGCAGDKHTILIEEFPSPGENAGSGSVQIIADVYPRDFSRSATGPTKGVYTPDTLDLPKGRYVHLYVYDEGETPETALPVNFGIYTAREAGVLAPLAAMYDLSLKPGTYDFYAISEMNNSSDKTPPFADPDDPGGIMCCLDNGLDYLWWSATGVEVEADEPTALQMVFDHVNTLIQINMHAAEGHTVDTIYQVTITGPLAAASILQFATGAISSSWILSGTYDMVAYPDRVYTADFVPFTPGESLTVMMDVTLDGVTSWKSFFLPPPEEGSFEGGNCYLYDAYLGAGEDTRLEYSGKR